MPSVEISVVSMTSCDGSGLDGGIGRGAVQESVAESLDQEVSQTSSLEVARVDSIFLLGIGLEQLEGHGELSIRILKLTYAIGGTERIPDELRDKLATFGILRSTEPRQTYRHRLPVGVSVDPSPVDDETGAFVEYGKGTLLPKSRG